MHLVATCLQRLKVGQPEARDWEFNPAPPVDGKAHPLEPSTAALQVCISGKMELGTEPQFELQCGM